MWYYLQNQITGLFIILLLHVIGWMTLMVWSYYNGQYHLFYQYNPGANVWVRWNWGHATSTRFVNGRICLLLLTPDNLGTIFSGSAVIDINNTAGFRVEPRMPMVAILHFCRATTKPKYAIVMVRVRIGTNIFLNPVFTNSGGTWFQGP